MEQSNEFKNKSQDVNPQLTINLMLDKFIQDMCILKENVRVLSKTLYDEYLDYLCNNGISINFSKLLFYKLLRQNFKEKRYSDGLHFLGIDLIKNYEKKIVDSKLIKTHQEIRISKSEYNKKYWKENGSKVNEKRRDKRQLIRKLIIENMDRFITELNIDTKLYNRRRHLGLIKIVFNDNNEIDWEKSIEKSKSAAIEYMDKLDYRRSGKINKSDSSKKVIFYSGELMEKGDSNTYEIQTIIENLADTELSSDIINDDMSNNYWEEKIGNNIVLINYDKISIQNNIKLQTFINQLSPYKYISLPKNIKISSSDIDIINKWYLNEYERLERLRINSTDKKIEDEYIKYIDFLTDFVGGEILDICDYN